MTGAPLLAGGPLYDWWVLLAGGPLLAGGLLLDGGCYW